MKVNFRDVAAGALFVAIGAAFGLSALFGLRLFGAFGLGPGFFPVLLSIVLVLLGATIVLSALGRDHVSVGAVSWRGVLLVTASIVVFALGLRRLGFLPTLFVTVLLAAMATSRSTWRGAVILALTLSLASSAVFAYALRLPLPLIGPWLGGY